MSDLKSQLDTNEREAAHWPEWKRQAASEDFLVGPGGTGSEPEPIPGPTTTHGHENAPAGQLGGKEGCSVLRPAQVIPTIDQVADTRARLLDLTSRRLIQFLDARNAALKLLDPPARDNGDKPAPDVAGAIRVLEGTGVLR